METAKMHFLKPEEYLPKLNKICNELSEQVRLIFPYAEIDHIGEPLLVVEYNKLKLASVGLTPDEYRKRKSKFIESILKHSNALGINQSLHLPMFHSIFN